MKKTKRVLGLLLVMALLITSIGIGINSAVLTGVVPQAETVSSSTGASAIHFYVPETIYLTPTSTTPWTQSTFKLYVDSTNSVTPTLSTDKTKTTGNILFYCADATNVKIECSGATITGTDPAMNTVVTGTTINTTITGGTLTTAIAEKTSATLTWTATYTVGGIPMTAKAYTSCYAPPREAIGVNQSMRNTTGGTVFQHDLAGSFYVSGVHSFGIGGGATFKQTGNRAVCPMLGNLSDPNGTNWDRYDQQTSQSNGGQRFFEHNSGQGIRSEQKIAPVGALTVDTSRYTDINQIPNYTCGLIIYNVWQIMTMNYYIADYDEGTVWLTEDGSNSVTDQDTLFKATGSKFLVGDATTARLLVPGIVYGYGSSAGDNVYSNVIDGNGTYNMRLKAAAYGYNRGESFVFSSLIKVTVTMVDKGTLRENIRTYTNMGLQAADYSNDATAFAAFQTELKDAAVRLGTVTGTDASDTLAQKYAALTRNTYTATITHTGTDGKALGTDNAGTVLTFNSGETVTATANTYPGYTLRTATTPSPKIWAIQRANVSYTFDYTPNTYTVTFNPQGGTVSPTTSTVTYNATYGAGTGGLPTPTRAGYTFDGWFTAVAGGGTQVLTSTVVAIVAAQTLYAKWTENIPYTISFDSAGGTPVTSIVQTANTTVTAPANPTRAGYIFTGWTLRPTTMPAQNTQCVAQWTKTVVSMTQSGTDLVVNIQGWAPNYKYQIWTYQKIDADILLNTAQPYQPNQWIMSQAYTLGSDGAAGAGGSRDFTIPTFTSPNNNYTIAVRIIDETGKYVIEIRQAFTPASISLSEITKVLVDGEYVRGSSQEDRDKFIQSSAVIAEIKTGAAPVIKVIGNLTGMTYTAKVVETGVPITASGTDLNEFVWAIATLEPRGYTVRVTASKGTSTDTWDIPFMLYKNSSTTPYGKITSMVVTKNDTDYSVPQDININVAFNFADAYFCFRLNEPRRAPTFKSVTYFTQGNIGNHITKYGTYGLYGYANRLSIDPFGNYWDDANSQLVVIKRAAGTSTLVTTVSPSVDLSAVPKSTAMVFTAVANIAGIGAEPVQYSFWRSDAGGHVLVKDWSSSNSLSWTPGKVGRYTLEVRAKGENAGSYEVIEYVNVNVTGTETIAQNVVITVNETELASAKAWTPITVKVSATTGDSATDLLYKFNVGSPSFDTQTQQNYSANQEFVWTPKKAGVYSIDVLVKNKDSFGSSDKLKRVMVTVAP